MKTKRFVVKEVVKFGMIFGYIVFDTKENKRLPYDFNEDEKHKAETRAELSNAFDLRK
jgi:hypothetical protein